MTIVRARDNEIQQCNGQLITKGKGGIDERIADLIAQGHDNESIATILYQGPSTKTVSDWDQRNGVIDRVISSPARESFLRHVERIRKECEN